MKVLMVEPGMEPYEKELNGLKEMQQAVGGLIQAIYPFEDKVAVVCDDEGMLKPNEFNRSMPGGYGGVFGPGKKGRHTAYLHRFKACLVNIHGHHVGSPQCSGVSGRSLLGASRFLNGSTRMVTGVLSLIPSSISAWWNCFL